MKIDVPEFGAIKLPYRPSFEMTGLIKHTLKTPTKKLEERLDYLKKSMQSVREDIDTITAEREIKPFTGRFDCRLSSKYVHLHICIKEKAVIDRIIEIQKSNEDET